MGDVGVVGGGPAGLVVASLIKDRDVMVFEEHKQVGVPRHCTSIVGSYTASFFSEILTPRIIRRGYNTLVIHSRLGRYRIEWKKDFAFYIERPLLEEKLVEKVEKLGHTLVTGVRVKPYSISSIKVGDRVVEFNTIIASDGSNSSFFRFFNKVKREYYFGIQSIILSKDLGDSIHVLYTGYPIKFAWVTPLDDGLGIIGYLTEKHIIDPRRIFEKVYRMLGLQDARIREFFGGIVVKPGYLSKPVLHKKVFFIGDALGLVKPFTLGGLYYIARLAPKLAQALDSSVDLYVREVEKLSKLNKLENILDMSFKSARSLYPPILSQVFESGLFNETDYDNHFNLFLKSIPTILLAPINLSKSLTDIIGKLHTRL
ncbi:NAD(P)-binding protein [Thermogladius sp. 4427co]|uniref:NAD(P)-binding protein n=1 Tax=Thermogladius sp. 4427co TaxID=3450718 RepID=UPI003F7A6E50